MHILFTRLPLESRLGGAEVQTIALMKGLIARGHTVAFLGSCPTLLRLCNEKEIPCTELAIGPPPVTKSTAVSFLWRRNAMRKALHAQYGIRNAAYPVDAVVMLSLSEKLLLTPHLHNIGVNVLWIEHDRVGRWLTRNPWLPQLHALSAMATTATVSELSRKFYLDLGWDPERTIAIPNGIDTCRLTPPPLHPSPNAGEGDEGLHIGTIARLSRDKGVDVLIEAVKGLPDVSMTIVGSGPEESRLRRRALAVGRSALAGQRSTANGQQISFTPWINDLPSFYHSLDCFVLPSREHDPFGLVAGEAMLMGIPTIVTDACGISGYLQNKRDALIVPAGSAQSLRDAITAFMSDPSKRSTMGAAGKHRAIEQFSMERMIQRYEDLLRA